jgi:hypothetical protein
MLAQAVAEVSRREPVSSVAERRREERIPVQAAVELHHETMQHVAELRDVSLNGAFVAVSPVTLSVGAGLRVEFTLPQGFRVSAFGRVAWLRQIPDDRGPAGYGIQFYGLDDINREFIQYSLDLARAGGGAPIAGGRIETRFEVTDPADNQLRVRLTGTLLPLEADSLEEAVCRKLSRLRRGQIFVYIDARDLAACPKASLEHIRAWLERLRFNRAVLGVLVGGNTIGVVQVRRLAREAGIADSLIMFDNRGEADEFWHSIVSASSSGPGAHA